MGYRINADQITTNYTQTLAEFVVNLKYKDIPPEVAERAKFIAMQTVGVSLGANSLPVARKAIDIGKCCGKGEPPATLWGDGSRVSMTSAAFTNGVLADALDWEDCSWTGHPSAGVIPVAWAVAEALHKSGKELITAIVAGYEVYQRVAMVVQPPEDWDFMYGWGLTSWQVFAGVVPAAKLMGLTADQVNQAFGFGATSCPIPGQLHHITMSDAYHFEHGFRAKDGVLSALTAKAGVDNYMDCFDDTYSFDYHMVAEPQRDWYTKDLGKRWLIMETLLKHWPANMWIQTPLELTYNIITKNNIKAENIEEIILDPLTDKRMYYSPDGYSSLTQAQFSVPFMLASLILDPVPGPQWYERSKLNDPELLDLASRVRGGDSEPHILSRCFKGFQRGEFPMKTITIKTKDGKCYSESMDCHPGHPQNMMTREEFCERFRIQAAPVLKGEKMEKAVEAFSNIERCEDISELSELLHR